MRSLHIQAQYQDAVQRGRIETAILGAVISTGISYDYVTLALSQYIIITAVSDHGNDIKMGMIEEEMLNTPPVFPLSHTTSSFLLGTLPGAALSGSVAKYLGRRNGLLLNNASIFLSALLLICAGRFSPNHIHVLQGSQFFAGFYTSMNSALVPLYLTEIAGRSRRGAVGSTYYLTHIVSALITFIFVSGGLFQVQNQKLIPVHTLLAFIPPLVQCLVLPFCPESPKFTFHTRHNPDGARKALMWLRGVNLQRERIIEVVEEEMDEMRPECEQDYSSQTLLKPLASCCVLMIVQQLCIHFGIGFVNYLFWGFSWNGHGIRVVTIILQCVAIVGVTMLLVDRLGRRPLLLFGVWTPIPALVLINVTQQEMQPLLKYTCTALIILAVLAFSSGMGPIASFFACEAFPTKDRACTTCIVVTINWISRLICYNIVENMFYFSHLTKLISSIFIGTLLVCLSVCLWEWLPETKRRPTGYP